MFLGGVVMQMFSAGAACMCVGVFVWIQKMVFFLAGSGHKHGMFVCAGP